MTDIILIIRLYGMAGYKDYAMHFRGFLMGTVLLLVISAVIATLVFVV